MKLFWFILLFFLASFQHTYALPIWLVLISTELFVLFWWILTSIIFSIFFYFKSLHFLEKILLTILILLVWVILYSFFLDYQKQRQISIYLEDMSQVQYLDWIDLYYDNYIKLVNKYDVSINKNTILNNLNNYILVDIREKSEKIWNNESFVSTRLPEILENHWELFWNINKQLVIMCNDWERSRLVSSILWNLWYESYYLKWWLEILSKPYSQSKKFIKNCVSDKFTDIYIGWNNKLLTKNIPFMQLTHEDAIKKFEDFYIDKSQTIWLSCNNNKQLNCWVWRQSFGMLLLENWYKNICLKN